MCFYALEAATDCSLPLLLPLTCLTRQHLHPMNEKCCIF